jgi:hypothetical protein
VALNSTSTYFDGPSVAQGMVGTWLATGSVTLLDTAGLAVINCKLWDGTTVVASAQVEPTTASTAVSLALSGVMANPAANIRIS